VQIVIDKGRRQILAVELVNRESQTSWQEVLLELKSSGLRGMEFVVSMITRDQSGPLAK
jgi:transposase-like protein